MRIKYPKSNLLSIVGALILSMFSMAASAQCAVTAPLDPTVSNITATSATFVWEDGGSTEAYGFYFEVRSSGAFLSGASGLESSGFTPAETVSVNDLPVNSNLTFYVKSVCDEGNTQGSTPVSITFMTPNLQAPVAITAIFIENDSFLAQWNPVPGAVGYLLDVSTSSSFTAGTFVEYFIGTDEDFNDIYGNYENFYTTGTSRIVNLLQANTTYYYRVRATTGPTPAEYTTGYSNTISVMTVMNPPTEVTWTAGGWTSDPTTSLPAIIDADFDSATDGNILGLTLTINPTYHVIIRANGFIQIVNEIINNSDVSGIVMMTNSNLFQENDVTNTGDITVQRESSLIKRLDYTMWSSPTVDGTSADQTLKQFSPGTVNTRFYQLNTLTNLFNDVNPLTTTFVEGKGYLIRAPNLHPTTATKWTGVFKGIPNNGLVNVAISNDGPAALLGINMIGNPYPSAISANEFIEKNTSLATPNISPTIYFWRRSNAADGDGSDPYDAQNTYYATYGYLGGTVTSTVGPAAEAPNGFIKPGQGFLVRARNTSATNVYFNNAMRSYQHFSGQFFRNSNATTSTIGELEKHRMWLNLTSVEGAFSQMLLGYVETGDNAVDKFDGLYIGDGAIALSSYLDNSEYTIQGRSLPFDVNDVVPLNFKTPFAGTYSISISSVDGLFAGENGQTIYLRDNLLNVEHNLETPYTFATEIGNFNDRFEVLYQSSLGVNNPVLNENNVVVFKQANDIMISAGTATIASVKVFDIRGRLLVEKMNVNASETSINAGSDKQVLIVQITSTDNVTVTKKVVN